MAASTTRLGVTEPIAFPARPGVSRGHLSLVSEACDDVIEHLDDKVASWVTQVRKDIPEYLSISFENHVSTNRDLHLRLWGGQLRMLERPSEADLAATRAVGRLRASQGVPLEALVAAYQVTHREIWDVLRAYIPPTSGLLGDITTFLLTRLQLMIEAVSQGYRAAQTVQGPNTLTLQRRLVGSVLRGATDFDVIELCEDLGFEPAGEFVGAWVRSSIPAERMLPAVLRSLHGLPVAARVMGGDLALLVQRANTSEVEELLASLPGGVGIGLARAGITGAQTSLGDAQRAVELVGTTGGVQLFEKDWLSACIHAERERLSPVLSGPARVAFEHPDLAETVRAFSDSGFSISKTAQKLNVHPNTASYRIDRWKALSGLDLRSGNGFAASLMVVTATPSAASL